MYNDYLASLDAASLSRKKAEAALRAINATKQHDHNADDSRIVELFSHGCTVEDIAATVNHSKPHVRFTLERFSKLYSRYEKAYWKQDKRNFGNQVLKRSGWHPIDYAVWSEDLGVSESRFERFKEAVHKRGAWVFEELEAAKRDPRKSPRRELLIAVTDNLIGMDAYQKLVDSADIKK